MPLLERNGRYVEKPPTAVESTQTEMQCDPYCYPPPPYRAPCVACRCLPATRRLLGFCCCGALACGFGIEALVGVIWLAFGNPTLAFGGGFVGIGPSGMRCWPHQIAINLAPTDV